MNDYDIPDIQPEPAGGFHIRLRKALFRQPHVTQLVEGQQGHDVIALAEIDEGDWRQMGIEQWNVAYRPGRAFVPVS
ncbi:MAG: hypothetical protein Q8O25_17600, partial [Sulfurisoma sp.]|nr:hypothetical protein [Sulfurisoma sp.]